MDGGVDAIAAGATIGTGITITAGIMDTGLMAMIAMTGVGGIVTMITALIGAGGIQDTMPVIMAGGVETHTGGCKAEIRLN